MRAQRAAACVAAVIALAAACGGDDDDDGGDGGSADRDFVIESLIDTAAEEGDELNRDDAECLVDVTLRFVDMDELVEATEEDRQIELDPDEGEEFGAAVLEECPAVVESQDED